MWYYVYIIDGGGGVAMPYSEPYDIDEILQEVEELEEIGEFLNEFDDE